MGIEKRYLGFVGMFITLLVCYVYRTTLSPTILVMFDDPAYSSHSPASSTGTGDLGCPGPLSTDGSKKSGLSFTPRIKMPKSKQSQLLSAYFYGYMLTNFLGSLLVHQVGPRITMMVGLGGSTLFNFLTVAASYIDGYEFAAIFACRFMIGIFCGPLYSSIHELIARWAPVPELTRDSVLTHSGNIVGLIVAFGCGYFVDKSDKAWEYYLYFCGCLGVVGFIIWCLFVYDQPWLHPHITEEEKNYIVQSLHPKGIPEKESFKQIPFKEMFTCPYIYIVACAHIANNFILYAFLTNHAKYLTVYYKVPPSKASLYSIIPFAFNTFCQVIAGYSITKLQQMVKKPVTFYRRVAGCIGFLLAPAFLIPVGFFGCDKMAWAEVFLSLSMGGIAFNQPGFFTQIIEISPRHASLTMGFSNMMASIPGFVTSPILYSLISANGVTDGYKYYFILTCFITMTGGIIWLLFCSSENQHWGENPKFLEKAEGIHYQNEPDKTETVA